MTLNVQVSPSRSLIRDAQVSNSPMSKGFIEKAREKIQQCMSSPSFYRLTVRSVFTRWFAVRRTKQVFDLMAGFVNFQVLLTCLKLGVLDKAYNSPATLEELSQHAHTSQKNLEPLVLSAVALGLLEHRPLGRFGIGSLGLPVVAYEGIRAMVEHNGVLYKDMQDTEGLIKRTTQSQMNEYWPYAKTKNNLSETQTCEKNADQTSVQIDGLDAAAANKNTGADLFARYSELMSASQNFVIDEILNTYDFTDHKRMLDIGCGKGRFVSSVANNYKHIEFELMDLPQVIQITASKLKNSNFENRLSFNPGSFKTHPLPSNVDLVTMVRIAHDHSDDVVAALLRKIYLALPPKGTLLLAEPMAESSGKGARHDAYFHFYLLAMGEGRLRTPELLSQMMLDAGFSQVRALSNPMPIHAKILVAEKE